jgi:peroxiredoxin
VELLSIGRQNPVDVTLQNAAQLACAIAAAVGIYSFVQMARDSETRRLCGPLCHVTPRYAANNRRAPDFELPRLGGGQRRLSDYRGKPVVLNFWSRNCPPCLKEFPALVDLSARLRLAGAGVVVSVNTDDSQAEVTEALKEVLGETEVPFDILLDPGSAIVAGKYGTKLFPETWFIDSEGIIRARVDGARDFGEALWLDLVASFEGVMSCQVEFAAGEPRGKGAELCEELTDRP